MQYYAIVWWSERGNLARIFGTYTMRGATLWAAFCLVAIGVGYGLWLGAVSDYWATHLWEKRAVLALTNTVAILHSLHHVRPWGGSHARDATAVDARPWLVTDPDRR